MIYKEDKKYGISISEWRSWPCPQIISHMCTNDFYVTLFFLTFNLFTVPFLIFPSFEDFSKKHLHHFPQSV
jgi:hypothetical protein